MSVMFCMYCGNYLLREWQYCPYCGRKISGESELVDALFRSGISGISVHIVSGRFRSQKTRDRVERHRIPVEEYPDNKEECILRTEDRKNECEMAGSPRVRRRVVEPEGMIERVGRRWVIRVRLPGARLEQIDVRQLETSIEVKAYKGDEAYFKQFEVPESAHIISKYMEGNELIVEIG
ncbi:MAG: zinc ribbon domain-containing protein [Theionarchaea archaeon]|nr:zinc ribbon domain-containing protein [Theionarchaea archaeon]MBU6999745.1 zinc ribbon domain-containing protein [Theionarchaea archaeon]MBU7020166.1 zinc ribbon domain-containing protein [Theionarchaea archaeon]MBU7033717.1 zinc ribbon domain-containing protein [Theionarchaea archaeon]MBU7039972.1 zinc ribbon domain-containing protein [Theionarchaea archaeon]